MALVLVLSAVAVRCNAAELPNIIIVYTDDLGYGDLSIYNPKAAYKTPCIDRMAREGINVVGIPKTIDIC